MKKGDIIRIKDADYKLGFMLKPGKIDSSYAHKYSPYEEINYEDLYSVAYCDSDKKVIRVLKEHMNPLNIIHEILHAIINEYKLKAFCGDWKVKRQFRSINDQEFLINELSLALFLLYKDNKELFDWFDSFEFVDGDSENDK